jgi:tRNA (guanine37-N1)-methyltransferase
MKFDILTLFPAMFAGPLTESILKRAQVAGRISIRTHDIRAYATDRHRTADDAPFGGGAGMVMKAEPLAAAIRAVISDGAGGERKDTGALLEDKETRRPGDQETVDADISVTLEPAPSPGLGPPGLESPGLLVSPSVPEARETNASPETNRNKALVVLMSPDGEPFTQELAHELAGYERLVLVCGHYEGVDERVREALVDREVSIGDYVLTGGELAAMVVVDAVARLVPGVIDAESTGEESFGDGLLEYPHYTRPAVWEERSAPPVLLSGHHGEVGKWRRRQRLERTLRRRPDLLRTANLSKDDLAFLASLGWKENRE